MNPHQPLADYMLDRLETLLACNGQIENLMGAEKRAVLEHYDQKRIERAEANRALNRMEYGLLRTHRFMALMGVCAFVEESVKRIAAVKVPDAKTRETTMKQVEGSAFAKHVHLLKELCDFDPDPVQSQIDQFKDAITLRNAVTHEWGKIDDTDREKSTNAALERLAEVAKQPNYELAGRSADGYLVPGHDLITYAGVDLAEPIVNAMLAQMLDVPLRR
jgi:hypothetical protein